MKIKWWLQNLSDGQRRVTADAVKQVVDAACARTRKGQHKQATRLRKKLRMHLVDYAVHGDRRSLKDAMRIARKG